MTMAEEEKNETTEETPEETPAAEDQAPEAQETPAAEADSTEAAPEESGGDSESPAPESQADAPGREAAEASDDDGLGWKTRKRLARSRESGEAGPQRSVEERAAARSENRAASGKARSAYRAKQRTRYEKGEGTAPVEHESAGRKERRGYVVSDKADKTITVRIDVARRHPAYEKIVRTSNTLHAHDESNEAGEGDLVKIVETRPMSKTKRWRLVEVMEKAK